MKVEIAKAIALLTTEYDLPAFTSERIEIWMEALSRFPEGTVTRAVSAYMQSNRFKPQLADIVAGCAAQMDNNWLGPEEAYALIPKCEGDSGIMTREIAEAAAAAEKHLRTFDSVAARMAFKEVYVRLSDKAKFEGRLPQYFPSFGSDALGRVTVLANGVQKGFITLDYATKAAPEHAEDVIKICGVKDHPLLAPPSQQNREKIKALLLELKVGK